MMPRLRRFIPPLTVALFALIVSTPLARGMGTCTDDAAQHITRAVEIEKLIRLGHFFPRWAPDLAHGFGYPLFNYYAPLSAYVVVLFHLLGFNFSIALQLTFFVALLASGLAMFALGRELWGEKAGLVAAVGYVSAPYFAFDILFRGALAESFAWIWPPLVLWGLARALRGGDEGRGAGGAEGVSQFTFHVSRFAFSLPQPAIHRSTFIAVLSYAALLLTHNNLALLASPLFAAFAVLLALERRSWRALFHGAGILVAGLALSAYFWVPALFERGLVQTDRLLVPPIFTYYTNWLTPRELLASPRADDPLLLNPSPAKALGLMPALLALPALAGLARRKFRSQWPLVTFFAAALVIYSLLTLPLSQPLWDRIPLLAITQFPWRMLSLAALCAALLAGAAVRAFDEISTPLTVLLGASLLVANLPWWYPRYCSGMDEWDVARVVQFEYDTGTLGTSAKGEFLPVTVRAFSDDNSLAEAIFAGKVPDRIDRASLPPDAAYTYLNRDPYDTRFSIVADEPFTLMYKNLYFPGWQVRVDGRSVDIRLTPDTGLISFELPRGEHLVEIRFVPTPLRLAASIISILSLLVFVTLWRLSAPRPTSSPLPSEAGSLAPLHPAFLLLPLSLLALKLAWFDQPGSPLRHTRMETVAQHPLLADFAGGVTLLGYDFSRDVVPSGQALDVSLYIGVREQTEIRWMPTFSLEDSNGLVWDTPDEYVPRWHREPPYTPLWPPLPDAYAQWSRQIQVLPGTPPGTYQLWATVYDLDTKQPDSVVDENSNPSAPRLLLGEIEVTRPPKDLSGFENLTGLQKINQRLSPSLTLLGYAIDRVEACPGDTLFLTVFWRADAPPIGEKVTLLVGEAHWEVDPVPGFPAERWQAGDEWRGEYLLVLPATLASGDYRVGLAVNGGETTELSELKITSPPHAFEQPPVQHEVNAQVGEIARLVGYNVEGDTITLVWQALSESPVSYSAFVHLSDGERNVAQSDSVPANYSRPTSGWLTGEYIVDSHPLATLRAADLPPGEYTLFAGLYDPRTGERAVTASADGRVPLGTLTIPP